MSGNVVENLARKYKEIAKGVKSSMGGNILEYEAKDILRRGHEEGHIKGKQETLLRNVEQIMGNLSVDLDEACRILGITIEEYEKVKDSYE